MSTDHDRLSEEELAEMRTRADMFGAEGYTHPVDIAKDRRKLLAHEAALKAELVIANELAERRGWDAGIAAAVAYCEETAVMIGETMGGIPDRMADDIRKLDYPNPATGAAPAKEIPILKGLPLCAHGMATCEVCCKKDGVADQTAAELGAAPPEAKGRKT